MKRLDVIDFEGELGPVDNGKYVSHEDALAAVAAERAKIRSALIARGDGFWTKGGEADMDGRWGDGLRLRSMAQVLYEAAAFLCTP